MTASEESAEKGNPSVTVVHTAWCNIGGQENCTGTVLWDALTVLVVVVVAAGFDSKVTPASRC